MQVSKTNLKNKLEFIASFLKPHTRRAYLVGGSVRDTLLGREVADFDIEIYDISPEKFDLLMQKLGANGFGKTFFVYKYENFDLSLARLENKTGSKHRDFAVCVCDNEKDGAKRRDFTINSMMINIFNDEFLDFYGGLSDLKARILRHIDDESFSEDPLRVLRAVHFVARFGLKIAPQSLKFMQTMDISALSSDRINNELYKFFKAADLKRGFMALCELNLEKRVFGFDSVLNKRRGDFLKILENARKFVSSEGLFLYLYLNFFGIDKKDFFKKTQLKKELLNAAKQDFCEGSLNALNLAKIATKMPLKKWLGLWDENRVNLAKKLGIYEEKLKPKFNLNALQKSGLKGENLGHEIEKQKEIWLEKFIQKKGF